MTARKQHDRASPPADPDRRARIPRGRSLGLVCAILLAALVPGAAAADDAEWVPVRDVSLVVPVGSALDFSHLSEPGEAGAAGRIVVGRDGHLATETEPAQRQRFHCAMLGWSPASGSFPAKEEADLYAQQLRVHGYNLARFHFVDAILMSGRERDFDYDPEQLDRFHYLLAALKRNGIYWVIDAMTSQNGALGGISPHRWIDRHDLKLRVHFDPAAKAHWRRLVETVLATVNPYTGMAPLEDPALALLVLVNENGLEFASILEQDRTGGGPYPPALRAPFNAWLAEVYRDTNTLAAAWPDLAPAERIEDGTVALPANREDRGPRMRDTQRFFRHLEAGTVAWMTREVRALGYRGLTTAYNNWATAETHFSRMSLPVVSMNMYFDEQRGFEPGASTTQDSSLDREADYVRELFAARWLGKPFVVTEHDHLFWNSFRYESGLVVPAYAALQGWDGLCRHAHGPIDLSYDRPFPHKQRIMPFGTALDPVARAGETLAALLFRRGDVAEAAATVAVPFGRETDMLEDGQGAIPDDLTALGLIARIGLRAAARVVSADDLSLPVSPASAGSPLPRMLGDALDAMSGGPTERRIARIATLRAEGVIGPSNVTDAAARVFHSATGEIVMRAAERFIAVTTPRTEAAAFAQIERPETLGAVTIEAASGPALLAVSALDGASVADSGRLLMIFATDAMNSGMTFRDPGRRTVQALGDLPVLIRRGTVDLNIAQRSRRAWTLTALHLDGTPGDTLALAADDAGLAFRLDNAAASHGPTTFFLLEAREP